MPVKNKNYEGVKLSPKQNGQKKFSSYTLNISSKEATTLKFVDESCNSYNLKKEIIDNKLIISRSSSDEKSIKLCKKKNSKGYISSYNLNISEKEARTLGLIDEVKSKTLFSTTACFIASKQITNNKLVVSRAFPQTRNDLYCLIQDFGLIGKHLSKKTLLDLLHFIEGDSESYIKQRDKVYDSIRANSRRLIYYQGQFCFFAFSIRIDQNKVIRKVFNVTRTPCDYF